MVVHPIQRIRNTRSTRSLRNARTMVVLTLVTATVGLTAVVTPQRASAATRPTVVGPIPGTPFDIQADLSQLATYGYVQQEYFFNGVAQAFDTSTPLTADGRWNVAPVSTAAYKTRMVVRRPSSGVKFNGTVFVEWLNVSAGFDTSPDWSFNRIELMRQGFAWVGISAQYVGVEGALGPLGIGGLKVTDPARYGTLSHPGDIYSYDIFTQAAVALRRRGAVKPLGPLRAVHLIADGESQSASRMTTYVNAIAPRSRVFAGYLIHSRSAGASGLATDGLGSQVPSPTFIRTDTSVPVMVVESETDVLGHLSARQADSAHYRLWEIAGTSHVDRYALGELAIAFLNCDLPVNSGPEHYVMHTVVRDLWEWVRSKRTPPSAPRIDVNATPDVVRDAVGNATGGIRTPELDVAVATLSGFGNTPAGFCGLFGTTTAFTPTQLAVVYGTKVKFQRRYFAAAADAVSKGFVMGADVPAVLAEAAAAPFPS